MVAEDSSNSLSPRLRKSLVVRCVNGWPGVGQEAPSREHLSQTLSKTEHLSSPLSPSCKFCLVEEWVDCGHSRQCRNTYLAAFFHRDGEVTEYLSPDSPHENDMAALDFVVWRYLKSGEFVTWFMQARLSLARLPPDQHTGDIGVVTAAPPRWCSRLLRTTTTTSLRLRANGGSWILAAGRWVTYLSHPFSKFLRTDTPC